MKNLKTTILTIIIALCCYNNSTAQEHIMSGAAGALGGFMPMISLSGGLSSPSSEAKDKAFLSNTTAINADLFLPILKKEGASFNFGINLGGTYSFGGSGGLGTLPSPYIVSGQTSSIVADRGGDPAQAGFRMGAGPQANFYLGKLIVSPMVLAQYMSVTQKERSAVQTTVVGGQSYDFALASLPETKTSGFAVTPKLRLHYMFNQRFGLFADASYTMGPKTETTVSKLIPNGNPQTPGNTYNIQQLQTGTMVRGETKSTAYNATGFNFGVVFNFGKLKPPYSPTNPNEEKAVRSKTKSNSANERTANITNNIILEDVDGPIDGNEKIFFLENVKMQLILQNKNIKIPDTIALIYKIKRDLNNNLYGIPCTLFGFDIPIDSTYALRCSPPCANIGAGICGGFCYRMLDIDHTYFTEFPKVNSSISTSNGSMISYEKITLNGLQYIIKSKGTIKVSTLNEKSNYCFGVINGYGTVVFEHIFSNSCENALKILNSKYKGSNKN